MNLNYVNKFRTVCEVTREINDILNSIKHKITPDEYNSILCRLNEQFTMQKKMAKKLIEYKKDWDDGILQKNENYEIKKTEIKKRKAEEKNKIVMTKKEKIKNELAIFTRAMGRKNRK